MDIIDHKSAVFYFSDDDGQAAKELAGHVREERTLRGKRTWTHVTICDEGHLNLANSLKFANVVMMFGLQKARADEIEKAYNILFPDASLEFRTVRKGDMAKLNSMRFHDEAYVEALSKEKTADEPETDQKTDDVETDTSVEVNVDDVKKNILEQTKAQLDSTSGEAA